MFALAACDDDGGVEGSESETEGETDDGDGMVYACGELLDEDAAGACSPNALDYQPGAEDGYPACVTDDGTYTLVSDTPSSIARVEAYADVMAQLAGSPTTDDFTNARATYSEEEGLESRLQRREDLHFPAIPEDQWDPGVDGDKQCTVLSNVEAYPQRCAGPALIAPIMNDAFAAGQTGDGDPAVHTARIEAAGLWFLYLSVYKEANTCFTGAAKDCDSAWAYYTGGFDRGGGIGLAAAVRAVDSEAHEAIWDGFSAFRCIRDLNPADDTPEIGDLDMVGQELLCGAQSQLTTALDYGLAQVVRDRLAGQADLEGSAADANWAFLQILGPVLDRGADERDAPGYASVRALWDSSAPPSAGDIDGALTALDTVFGCP